MAVRNVSTSFRIILGRLYDLVAGVVELDRSATRGNLLAFFKGGRLCRAIAQMSLIGERDLGARMKQGLRPATPEVLAGAR
jgi:hypothetical protein